MLVHHRGYCGWMTTGLTCACSAALPSLCCSGTVIPVSLLPCPHMMCIICLLITLPPTHPPLTYPPFCSGDTTAGDAEDSTALCAAATMCSYQRRFLSPPLRTPYSETATRARPAAAARPAPRSLERGPPQRLRVYRVLLLVPAVLSSIAVGPILRGQAVICRILTHQIMICHRRLEHLIGTVDLCSHHRCQYQQLPLSLYL